MTDSHPEIDLTLYKELMRPPTDVAPTIPFDTPLPPTSFGLELSDTLPGRTAEMRTWFDYAAGDRKWELSQRLANAMLRHEMTPGQIREKQARISAYPWLERIILFRLRRSQRSQEVQLDTTFSRRKDRDTHS